MKELSAILGRICGGEGSAGVLATLVAIEGSSYRRPGARILASPTGERTGSISGGCLEEDVMERAREVWTTGTPALVSYDTSAENDLVWGVGLGCNGTVHVLLEKLPPRPAWAAALRDNLQKGSPTSLAVRWKGPADKLGTRLASADSGPDWFIQTVEPHPSLFIFGAGDDAQPLARLAHEIGWRVTVADARPAFATPERFPTAYRVFSGPVDSLVAQANPPPDALHVVMTHRYVHDVPVLQQLLPRPWRYLGMLGPRKRSERILDEISKHQPLAAEKRCAVRAPVGYNLGADTPEEVALSIVAEIQAHLGGGDGRALSDRAGPIH